MFVKMFGSFVAMRRLTTFHLPLASKAWSVLVLPLTTVSAFGQTATADTRADIQQARANAAASTGRGSLVSRYAFGDADAGQGTNLGFTFNALLPVFYNSNAEGAPVGGTRTAETNPEFRLGWTKQLTEVPVKLSALVDANSDRYAHSNGADGDVVFGKFRAQYVTGNDDQEFEPFISYAPKSAFASTFASPVTTQHDLTIGFDKAFNYDYAFQRIGYGGPIGRSGDTSSATVWSFGFTGTLTRRLTGGADSTIATAAPSVTYNLTNLPNSNSTDAQWNISFETDISRRWYDSSNGVARMDWIVNPILTIEFIPPSSWFSGTNKLEQENGRKFLGRPVIDFQISFAQAKSNQAGSSFQQWAIGPMLKTAWKF
jgi:hypothetical protein